MSEFWLVCISRLHQGSLASLAHLLLGNARKLSGSLQNGRGGNSLGLSSRLVPSIERRSNGGGCNGSFGSLRRAKRSEVHFFMEQGGGERAKTLRIMLV